jgi:hypothetical protein
MKESTSLFMVFKKKDVRVLGLNDLASLNESRPGLGINITLTALHAYDNFNPMLQHARKYSILSHRLIGNKTFNSPSHLSSLTTSEARSKSSWAGSCKTWWCASIGQQPGK